MGAEDTVRNCKICGSEETDTLIESIINKGIERVEGVGERETVVGE